MTYSYTFPENQPKGLIGGCQKFFIKKSFLTPEILALSPVFRLPPAARLTLKYLLFQ